jgi:hypothetical protein
MTPPLHEIVLAYKMESDRLMISIDTDMGKLCAIFCLSLDYVELMKFDPEISSNDIEVWGALSYRYLTGI